MYHSLELSEALVLEIYIYMYAAIIDWRNLAEPLEDIRIIRKGIRHTYKPTYC